MWFQDEWNLKLWPVLQFLSIALHYLGEQAVRMDDDLELLGSGVDPIAEQFETCVTDE